MQAPTPSQRSIQRRSPTTDPGPPPAVPARSISPATLPPSRGSLSSAKSAQTSGGSRRQNVSLLHRDPIRSSNLLPIFKPYLLLIYCSLGHYTFSVWPVWPTSVANREKCDAPPRCHEAAIGNAHTMVPKSSYGCAGLRCVC
jgi:hypothetical protein